MASENQPTTPSTEYPENWSTTPGIYLGIPEREYHMDTQAVSKSQLDHVNRSAAHWRHYMSNPDENQTDAMVLGSLVDCMVLEPERFGSRYAVHEINRVTKVGKAEWADLITGLKPGQMPVKKGMVDYARNMANSVLAHPRAGWLLQDAEIQATVVWQDNEEFRQLVIDQVGDLEGAINPEPTNLYCRSRIDSWKMAKGVQNDLKSAARGAPVNFARTIEQFRYHVQGAFYMDGGAAHGWPGQHFLMTVVESAAPFVTTLYRLADAAMDYARVIYMRNLDSLMAAKQSGIYYGYAEDIIDIDLPAWVYGQTTL